MDTFEKFVDIDGILRKLLDELHEVLKIEKEKEPDFVSETAIRATAYIDQNTISQLAKKHMRIFIERGQPDAEIVRKKIISDVLKEVAIDNVKITELNGLYQEGIICKLNVNVRVEAYSGEKDIACEFLMKNKGTYWQVKELTNLSEIIHQLAQLKRTFPYRNLTVACLHIARSIKDESEKAIALKEIAIALKEIAINLGKAGKTEQATLILSEAMDTARSIKDSKSKAWLMYQIGTDLRDAGKIQAFAIFAEAAATIMTDVVDRLEADCFISNRVFDKLTIEDLITTVISSEIEVKQALNIFSKAIDIARSIKDEYYKAYALRWIGTELAKIGKTEQASAIFAEAADATRSIKDENRKAGVLEEIAVELAKAGKTEQAIDIARSINKASALRDIAAELAKAGKTEQATVILADAADAARSIKDERYKAWALERIAAELAKAGKTEQAIDIARSIKDEYYKASALKDIAAELAKAGKTEQATAILAEAADAAKSIKDEDDKIDIAAEFAKAGKTEQALDIVKSIKNETIRKSTCMRIGIQHLSSPLNKTQERELATNIMKIAD
jgi:tetratricopeptide (TPR) repeat protein